MRRKKVTDMRLEELKALAAELGVEMPSNRGWLIRQIRDQTSPGTTVGRHRGWQFQEIPAPYLAVECRRGGQEPGSTSGTSEAGQLRTAETGADQLPDRDPRQPLRPGDECHRASPTVGGVSPEQLGDGECGRSPRTSAPSPTCTLYTPRNSNEDAMSVRTEGSRSEIMAEMANLQACMAQLQRRVEEGDL